MIIHDPRITCEGCKKQFTLHGKVDLVQLQKDWLKCPWCGKILTIIKEDG